MVIIVGIILIYSKIFFYLSQFIKFVFLQKQIFYIYIYVPVQKFWYNKSLIFFHMNHKFRFYTHFQIKLFYISFFRYLNKFRLDNNTGSRKCLSPKPHLP